MIQPTRPKGIIGSAVLAAMLTAIVAAADARDGSDHGSPSATMGPNIGVPPQEAIGKPTSTRAGDDAPQILGVVASHGPVPLQCDLDGCRAELSTFCLQQGRENPERGQVYAPIDGADIVLSGRNAAGDVVRLAAAPYLRFAAARGFTATEVTLSSGNVAELGLNDLAIGVGEKVSLLPATTAGNGASFVDEETALATGPFRERSAAFFDRLGGAGDAIRLANLMINALPAHGRSAGDSDGRVLEAAVAAGAGRASGIEGVTLARRIYGACEQKVDTRHHFDSMRACLEAAHDRLVANTNVDFWNSLGSY
jgi:hypothetical protein